MIDVLEMAPQIEKATLEFGVVIFIKVLEKRLENLFLLLRQVRNVIKLVYVSKIGKHFVGINHVLVNVIKVGEQQLAPSIELVKRFITSGTCIE